VKKATKKKQHVLSHCCCRHSLPPFLGGVAFPDEKKKVIVNCKEREKVHEK